MMFGANCLHLPSLKPGKPPLVNLKNVHKQ